MRSRIVIRTTLDMSMATSFDSQQDSPNKANRNVESGYLLRFLRKMLPYPKRGEQTQMPIKGSNNMTLPTAELSEPFEYLTRFTSFECYSESARAVFVGLLWFVSSSLISTWANTAFLRAFQHPLLHNFVRFSGSAGLGLVGFYLRKGLSVQSLFTTMAAVAVPALLLFIANYSNSVSLGLAGITLTYVVKACIPVLTVLICTLGGQRFLLPIYLSLIPICLGIAVAAGGDLNFTGAGLLAALVSALAQTGMNLTVKGVRARTGLSGPETFLGMSSFCTLFALPLMASSHVAAISGYSSPFPIMRSVALEATRGRAAALGLFLVTAFGYYMEYILTFVFVGYVSPVTFSVTDIARRVCAIVVGSLIFQKLLTRANWGGLLVAIGGVLWYSYLDGTQPKPPQDS